MIDLGKYATTVLSAYAVSLVLIIGVVIASVRAHLRTKADLARLEGEK